MAAKTWEEVKTFDDIVLPFERKAVKDLETELKKRCPHIKKEGDYFYYCGFKFSDKVKDKKPSPDNPIYQRHVSIPEVSLYCMNNFEECCFYSGKIKRAEL